MNNSKISNFQYTTPKITRFQYFFTESSGGKWEINIKHSKTIKKISDNEAKVILDMAISASDSPSPFEVAFSVEAKFRWEMLDINIVSTLLSQTAPSLLVGYARPIVAMFTNSSGITPFNIPMIDFTQEQIINFLDL